MTNIRRALEAAAAGGGDATYVEDVFSADLYPGQDTTLTITNGIDLDGEGGMVWIKSRGGANDHYIADTARNDGTDYGMLASNLTSAQAFQAGLQSVSSTGFVLDGNVTQANRDGHGPYVSWSFRKAPGFFDVQTYTGNGSNQTISHNLGSTPGFVIVKPVSATGNWSCWSNSIGDTNYILLNSTAAKGASGATRTVNSTTYEIFGTWADEGADTVDYVMYLFASDDQSFGADSDESIIKCGSFTSSATWGNYKVDLGWEPQYVLIKQSGDSGNWTIFDSMRGITGPGEGTLADTSAFNTLYATSDDAELQANSSSAESLQGVTCLYSQGIIGTTGFGNRDYIYMAIRRPMKVPEAGTEVFSAEAYTGNSTAGRVLAASAGFPLDVLVAQIRVGAGPLLYDRMRGNLRDLETNTTAAGGASSTNVITSFNQAGFTAGDDTYINASYTYIAWMFKRASKCMDVVTQVGDGVGGASWNHGLGVVPEMIIGKNRTDAVDWAVYHHGVNGGVDPADWQLQLNDTAAQVDSNSYWDNVLPTTTHFTTGGSQNTNGTGDEFIFYLFATLAGVSKVGSYTADATLTTINCGFAAGARFILIKRTDAASDWYVYDYARGIVAGNDPYLLWNDTGAEVTGTDYIDPENSGFQLTAAGSGTINVDTGEYIFLAIA